MTLRTYVLDLDRLSPAALAEIDAARLAFRSADAEMVSALLDEELSRGGVTDGEAKRNVGRRLLLNPSLAKKGAEAIQPNGVLWNRELRRTQKPHDEAVVQGWDWLQRQETFVPSAKPPADAAATTDEV